MSKRKKWPAAEKLRIVLAGMQPNVEVSELPVTWIVPLLVMVGLL